MITQVALVNGIQSPLDRASLAVTDAGIARGDGAFETIGVWDGVPFRVPDHLDRLNRSLRALGLPPAPVTDIRHDMEVALKGQTGDGALRIFVTASGSRIVSLSEPPARTPLQHLISQPAPWIRPVGTYGPSTSKAMSYGPNMAASRAAQIAGGDDALLISLEGHVLEGPTFSVLWARGGAMFAPALELGLVDSITRRTVLELAAADGVTCHVGRYTIDDVAGADEALTCSSVRPLRALASVDGRRLPARAPLTTRLAEALAARRRGM